MIHTVQMTMEIFMDKKIRSVSLARHIDEKIVKDSKERGLTVSANLARILHDYFQNNSILSQNRTLKSINPNS